MESYNFGAHLHHHPARVQSPDSSSNFSDLGEMMSGLCTASKMMVALGAQEFCNLVGLIAIFHGQL